MSLKLNSSGSGSVTLQEPVTASNRTLNLPDVDATVLTDSAGVLNIGSGQVYKDASGNVGIGTSSPTYIVQAYGTAPTIASGGTTYLGNSSTVGASFVLRSENTSSWLGTRDLISFDSVGNGADHRTGTLSIKLKATNSATTLAEYLQINAVSNYISFSTASTERARITSGGDWLVGTTTNGGVGWTFEAVGYSITKKSGTATTVHISFQNNNGEVGKISTSGTATTYGTSSDYRLKENVQPMSNALAKVAELKPVTYKWKVDGSDGQGFIAHELQSVCPDAVIGEKDAVETYIDDSGTEQTRPVYQAVDTSFLIATLTAAIQELKAIVDAQAAEIAALKGAA